MPKLSAALLVHRVVDAQILEGRIVHPGGPFWANKDLGSWSIPKGEYGDGETPWEVAQREFFEEVGVKPPDGNHVELGELKQPSGKRITTFAVRGDVDLAGFHSNTFEMEWPKRSGRQQAFPEVDRAEWVSLAEARRRLLKGHVPFLDLLLDVLRSTGESVNEGVLGPASSEDDSATQASLF